jgi:hypothetical protein
MMEKKKKKSPEGTIQPLFLDDDYYFFLQCAVLFLSLDPICTEPTGILRNVSACLLDGSLQELPVPVR